MIKADPGARPAATHHLHEQAFHIYLFPIELSSSYIFETDFNKQFCRFLRNRCLVTTCPALCGKLSMRVPILRERLKSFLIFFIGLKWKREHYGRSEDY